MSKLRKLEFELYCENEDYSMVSKIIRNLEELKNNEENYLHLDAAEKKFSSQYEGFKRRKRDVWKGLAGKF